MSATYSSLFHKDVVSDYTTDNDEVRLYHCDRKVSSHVFASVKMLSIFHKYIFKDDVNKAMFSVYAPLHKVSPENSYNT